MRPDAETKSLRSQARRRRCDHRFSPPRRRSSAIRLKADRGQRHQRGPQPSAGIGDEQSPAAPAPCRGDAQQRLREPCPARPPARLRPRSRSGFRGQTAEPALSPGIFGDRAFERGLVEIRPMDRHEHQFAVGRLPHQEVRQPLLAAGADDQIGIGNIGRVEISAERVGVDRRGIAFSFRDFARQPLRRVAISCRDP